MKYLCITALLLFCLKVSAADDASRQLKNIVYKNVGDKALKLDLYLPETVAGKRLPLVIWLHGGAWMRGTKDDFPGSNPLLAKSLLNAGYAIASVGYRLSGEAIFPAPVQDINDALNFLQLHSANYGVLADKVVVMGRSAGGHLATLTAMLNSHPDVDFYSQSNYRVVAAVSFFGPVDLQMKNNDQDMPRERMEKSPTARLLGGIPSENPVLARKASSSSYVSSKSPPVMMLHGEQDRQVSVAHSQVLKQRLDDNGVDNLLMTEKEAKHSDKVFDTSRYVESVVAFVGKYLPRE